MQCCRKLALGAVALGICNGSAVEGLTFFEKEGYLVVRNFASATEVAGLRQAVSELLDAWDVEEAVRQRGGLAALLSLRNDASNHSFLFDSSAQASIFPEPAAIDPQTGGLKAGLHKRHAVRKVAHGVHMLEGSKFQDFVRWPKLAALAASLGLREALVVQSLYRLVPPLAAGVDRHQDSTTLYTEPPSVLGFWLALEDADETNGCLRVLPGSHQGPLRERLYRRKDGDLTRLVFERIHEAGQAPPLSGFMALPMSAGDLVVLHGTIEHFSEAGIDPERSRESFQVHMVDAGAKWSPDNCIQYPPHMPFMRVGNLSVCVADS